MHLRYAIPDRGIVQSARARSATIPCSLHLPGQARAHQILRAKVCTRRHSTIRTETTLMHFHRRHIRVWLRPFEMDLSNGALEACVRGLTSTEPAPEGDISKRSRHVLYDSCMDRSRPGPLRTCICSQGQVDAMRRRGGEWRDVVGMCNVRTSDD